MSEFDVGRIWRSTDPRDDGRRVRIVEHYPVGDRFRVKNVCTGRLTTIERHGLTRRFSYEPERVPLVVHTWHTECGSCGYGRGGWAGGSANEGKPILTPKSTVCHGCGKTFTDRVEAA